MSRRPLSLLVWLAVLVCLAVATVAPSAVVGDAAGERMPRPASVDLPSPGPTEASAGVQASSSSSWRIETVDSTADVGQYASLALDAGDLPHIAYLDGTGDDLKYAHLAGFSWVSQTVASAYMAGYYASLAVDAAARPHIAYLDNVLHDLVYTHLSGTVWLFETVDPDIEGYTSLALDASGRPRIAYYGDNDDLWYAHDDGGGWVAETVDFAGVVGLYATLAPDVAGRPHVGYYDSTNKDLKYARYVGSGGNCGPGGDTWQCDTVESAGDVGQYSSLALDAAGRPHISYYHAGYKDLRYAYYSGSAWVTATVEGDGDVGQYNSLALDAADRPHISYYHADDKDLRYAYYSGSAWVTATVDSTGDVGQYSSLTLDAAGRPHIAYYRADTWDLKYAYVCTSADEVVLTGPAVPRVGETAVFTATHIPVTASVPLLVAWDNGTVGPTAAYTWTAPGAYTVAVTVTNPCSVVPQTMTVTVCQPVQDVQIGGPADLLVGEAALYTATYEPPTTTLPVTLTWDNGTVSRTAAYSWSMPGIYAITVTATNPCREVRQTMAVTVCQPVEGVQVLGPLAPSVGETALYTATYSPLTTTLPVSLTWDNGAVGLTAAYSWTTSGSYTVTVTATNRCGEARGTLEVVACFPITDASFAWAPQTPRVGERVTFTGTATSSLPISFTWDLGGVIAAGQVVTHVFATSGLHPVLMTVTSPCRLITVSHTLDVRWAARPVYLPVVVKHWNRCFLGPLGFWEVEDNDYIEDANGLFCSGVDYYAFPDDLDDFFAFIAGEGTTVVEMWGYAPGDYGQMLLYDEAHERIGWDPDPLGGWRISVDTVAGRYYLRIYTAAGFTSEQPYTLRVTFPQP